MSSAAVPPAPEMAEIPLPPGMTLDQFQVLQSHLISIAITVSVAFGVVVWDYFVQLPSEIALYTVKERSLWKTPATWWFVVLRYSGILATLPSLFFTATQSKFCQEAVSVSQVGAVLVVASSGAIFWYRVKALWNGSIVISAISGFFYLAMVGCWIAVASQFRADQGPPTPFLSNCELHPVVHWAPISYASSVAFDSCVLVLTLVKFHGNISAAKSNVGRQVYRDNLLYFVLMTVANVTVLSIQALRNPSFDQIKPVAVPFSTLMTVTMGTRVFLNLRLFNQRQHNLSNSLPLSGKGQYSNPSEGLSSGIRTPMVVNNTTKQYEPYSGELYQGQKVSVVPL
ncbi:hypothetical protein P691DRAFT_776625 [Macrolepiota fuliginosa MF-IS2]|uniref:Uncharacterized protein n=1 Tax=Macrolepiota fuliginosa MF-IS2 TaxID=1400762 RepID=A0A9P5X933_9AGAR|nr:hypothetical protein P691DRAFT_776625 [Macrolepiota fuliginosa MF-IS2]